MQDNGFETISRLELNRRMREVHPENMDPDKGYALVNVLSRDDYDKEHIPRSINIPMGHEELFEKRYSKEKPIIVYCASSTAKRRRRSRPAWRTKAFKMSSITEPE